MSNVSKRGQGRPAKFETKRAVVSVLSGENVSYYHKRQLVKDGYFVPVPVVFEDRGRGRPAFNYELTSKGRALLNLAKNWTKAKSVQVALAA